ncbi:MAG: hypothetical protein K2G67_04220 [Muribaculaceae bacterium]|nr:hypothetical protein [Muribaculaceae bacterium]
MKKSTLLLGCVAAVALVTGCTDSAYDLSDIDSTTEIKINNLAIPINMEAITLDQIIDVKEGESLKVVNGKYAVSVDGSFSSDPIKIKNIHIASPSIAPTITTLNQAGAQSSMLKAPSVNFAVPEVTTSFSYYDDEVDPAVVDITSAKVSDMVLAIKLSLPELTSVIDEVIINHLTFDLPKGLSGTPSMGSYDSSKGLLTINNVKTSPAGLNISLPISEIDLDAAGAIFDSETHTFDFQGEIKITDGEIGVDPTRLSNPTSVPTTIDLRVDYNMSALDVNSICGRLQYDVPDFVIPDVDLTNLPDFLRQKGTNIILNNPQIYLSLDNPLYATHLSASTGLTLTAIRDGRPTNVCSLSEPVKVGSDKGVGPYNFCLSPYKPDFLAGFENAEYVNFKTLGHIVEGDGLPEAIHIIADDPSFPAQDVTDLKIGYDYGSISGKYNFYAPLALDAGSTITYSDSDTGWASDDLDDLTIENIRITANVTTDVNAEVIASGSPLDKQELPMANVNVSSVTVPANAKDYPIEINVTGDIKGIDGFLYTVRIAAPDGENADALGPDQQIKLTNIRAYATGKYVTKP